MWSECQTCSSMAVSILGRDSFVGPVTLDKEGLTLVQDDLHQVTQHGRQSLHARDLGDACRQHLALT